MSKTNTNLPSTVSDERHESNRDIILAYYESGGVGVELTDFQYDLMERWERADEFIRRNVGKKNREEIANMLRAVYKYHRATAYRDMKDAEYVFASSKPLNKKYMIGLRIENCIKRIRDAQVEKNDKLEAALETTLQKYIDMYPDDIVEPGTKTIQFIIDRRKADNPVQTVDIDAIIEDALTKLPNGK